MLLFDKLNSNNYNTWNGDMGAWFRAQALWRIVSGVSKPPAVSATPKEGEEDKLERWQLKADKAAGIMWLMVDNTQRVHFRGIKDDPVNMWGTVKEVHMQKRPGSTKPLELVHSDLHGPLPVATCEGYRYWITYLDDATSYRAAMRLKQKSQALEAFKLFKATAENQLDARIKELQDEKGWEYMSNELISFTDSCGIH